VEAQRHTLLIVDDEPDVLEILTRTFERMHDVRATSSALEALEILKRERVDLIITDQKMPELTGIELVRRARTLGVDAPAILLTGYTNPTDLIAAINEGQVYRYVTKPWDTQELRMTVQNGLELSRLKREREGLMLSLKRRADALSVLCEVARQVGPSEARSYDAIIEKVLSAIAQVFPFDCGGALIALNDGKNAALRLRCQGPVSEKGLLVVKETLLGAYRKSFGTLLAEDRIVTRVAGGVTSEAAGASSFASQALVPLVSGGRPIGTLALFAQKEGAFTLHDGELLEALANQTTEAILGLRAVEDDTRRRMERMVESMADGVLLTDERNEIVVINPAARKLLQLGEDPKTWTARHLQETLGFYPFELVRGWEYGGSQVLREELTLFDRTIHSTVSPVTNARVGLTGVVVVLRDISEQKQLDQRKEEFVSIVGHELRTPLTAISGALELVLNNMAGALNEKQSRYLGMAKDSTDKLNAVVDDLLDVSKFAQGGMRMAFELMHLNEHVCEVVERYQPAALEKKLKLSVSLPEAPVRVLADPHRLTQVFNNLLTNSVKFTPEGGEIRLELKAQGTDPGFATVSLFNGGEPIAEADLERIFDKFEQARSVRTRTIRGTGLGLSICRGIIEAHGGRIWAERCTTGAQFVVVIPLQPPQSVLEGTPEALPSQPAATPGRGTVLVIEDEPDNAYILKAQLLSRGFQVLLARNGEEGLVLARKHRPELITLDIGLPDFDGLRLAEIFRHDPETRHIPLLALSGKDERRRASRIGVNAYLQKPVAPETFLASVDGLVRTAGKRAGTVLIVDDDQNIAAICSEVLSNLGFQVTTAHSLAQARKSLRETRPDVLILDVSLPDGEGFELLEEVKAERASSHMSVVFISARTDTATKIRGLKTGGEDYLTKPFDAMELGARIEAVMRRKEQEIGSSPTTQLPGSGAIEREVQRRLREGKPFAFCYLDLDNLKAYNDYYGFAKADGVIRQTGDLLREVVAQHGAPSDFIGHVAGDDFVLITDPRTVNSVCENALESFDRIIPLYYDKQDRERGFIEAEDRFGQPRKFPIMSVSIVAVMASGGASDHPELARQAAEMKKRAKAITGSVFLRSDRDSPVGSVAG